MTDTLTIRTNNHPRDVIDAFELTLEERKEFDYLDWQAIDRGEDSASFVRYQGELHDLGEFMRVTEALRGWDGYRADAFFFGLVIRYTDDSGEQVIVGSYCC